MRHFVVSVNKQIVRSAVEPFNNILHVPPTVEEQKVLTMDDNDSLTFWLDEDEPIEAKCNEHRYLKEFFCLGMLLAPNMQNVPALRARDAYT